MSDLPSDYVYQMAARVEQLEQALARMGDRGGDMLDDPAYQGGQALITETVPTRRMLLASATNRSRPRLFSLTFDVVRAGGDDSAGQNHRPQARIFWGSTKGQHTAVIDLISGARTSLIACSLTVDVSMFGFDPDGTISTLPTTPDSPELKVHLSVGYGGLGKAKPNTYTAENILGLTSNSSTVVIPPKYARRVMVKQSSDPYGSSAPRYDVQFLNTTTALGGRVRSGFITDEYTVIPAGIEALRITNRATFTNTVQAVYELAI